MRTIHTDIFIIGAGAAGMAAALAAEEKGYKDILIAERGERAGGVLLQCAHKGFGLGFFGEDLTGMEYAARFRMYLTGSRVKVMFGTMVLKLYENKSALVSGKNGPVLITFDKCVLAAGCRERTIQSLDVSGTRPAGIMTCGTAQKLMNIDGLEIGGDIVILGTGDVGQIVARQLIVSGKRVITMIEKENAPGGLKRNRENCIEAYHIPVMTNSEIIRISGEGRISGVHVRHNDTGEEEFIRCSALLTAIGMIPEKDLAEDCFGNNPLPDWLFITGNCDYVHDIVDSVTTEALKLTEVI